MIPERRLNTIIFDWAGTTVDFGSRAPMGAIIEVFRTWGIELTTHEARGPMGLPKRDHVAAILALPRVATAWQQRYGHPPDDADVDQVYEVFVPMNRAVVTDFADLIPGVVAIVAAARARGLKIGSTTGYTPDIMAPLAERAAAQGYRPDTIVCAGDTAIGRPSPLMIYKCFLDLAVWPAWACVKVDDTRPGIEEGRAAGCWTVGVSCSGNEVGLSLDAWRALPDEDKARRRSAAAATLRRAGAHYVIDTVADLVPCLDEIDTRLERGERP